MVEHDTCPATLYLRFARVATNSLVLTSVFSNFMASPIRPLVFLIKSRFLKCRASMEISYCSIDVPTITGKEGEPLPNRETRVIRSMRACGSRPKYLRLWTSARDELLVHPVCVGG